MNPCLGSPALLWLRDPLQQLIEPDRQRINIQIAFQLPTEVLQYPRCHYNAFAKVPFMLSIKISWPADERVWKVFHWKTTQFPVCSQSNFIWLRPKRGEAKYRGNWKSGGPPGLESRLDRSQSLFYFVPQEKRLIRRPCWGWKNMGELNLHQEDGPPQGKMHLNGYQHMPGFQEHSTDSIFIHFSGCDSLFSKCYIPIYSQFTPRGPKYIQ